MSAVLSPSSIISILRQSSKGQLVYERQPQTRDESFSDAHDGLYVRGADSSRANMGLPGSLADISSVLEDVSAELADIQIRRVANVMSKIDLNRETSSNDWEVEEPITPPKRNKTEKKSSPPPVPISSPTGVSDVITRELMIMEAVRRSTVEANIKKRRLRMASIVDDLRQRSALELGERLKSIEADAEKMIEEELEAGRLVATKAAEDLRSDSEEMRKRREVKLEAEIKSIEAKRRSDATDRVLSGVEALSGLVSQLSSKGDDSTFVTSRLKPVSMDIGQLQQYLANLQVGHTAMSIDDLCVAADALDSMSAIVGQVLAEVEQREHQRREEGEAIQKSVQEQKIQQEMQQQQQEQLQQPKQSGGEKPQDHKKISITTGPPVRTCSEANLANLDKLLRFRNDWVGQFGNLEQDKNVKFACHKAVTTPLNAISDVTSNHLEDKLDKLSALLQGKSVEINNGAVFSASSHPQGVAYAKNLLAKKFVSHGEEVVSSKPKSAFAIAAVVVSLWSQHGDFGNLFLAHLYEANPYLVPKHPGALEPGESEMDYLTRKMGYQKVSDQSVEDQTMFLKRMAGSARMYAAIAISRLPESDSDKDHPHGLGNVWRWIASTMNLEPLNDVTATLVHEVLEVCGSSLRDKYGRMFTKLLSTMKGQFFSKIQTVTEDGCGGPVSRLEAFLKKHTMTADVSIPPPDGLLRADFL